MIGYGSIERAAKKVQSIKRPPIYRVVYLEQKCRRALFVFVSPTVSTSAPATIFMPSGPMQQPGSTWHVHNTLTIRDTKLHFGNCAIILTSPLERVLIVNIIGVISVVVASISSIVPKILEFCSSWVGHCWYIVTIAIMIRSPPPPPLPILLLCNFNLLCTTNPSSSPQGQE